MHNILVVRAMMVLPTKSFFIIRIFLGVNIAYGIIVSEV